MQPVVIDANTLLILSAVLPIALTVARVAGELLLQGLAQRLPAAKRARIEHEIGTVVAAVESAAKGVPGPEKKQIAQELIGEALKAARLKASEQQINTLIEAAVTGLKVAGGTGAAGGTASMATLAAKAG